MSPLDPVSLGPGLSIRAFARADFAIFVYGMSCLGSLLLTLDLIHMDSSLPLHSFSKLGLSAFAYGLV